LKKRGILLFINLATCFLLTALNIELSAEMPNLPSFEPSDEAPVVKTGRVQSGDIDSEFKRIDAHALRTPKQVTYSVPKLAQYLVKPARNEKERVRAISRWIAANISYDFKFLDLLVQGRKRISDFDYSSAAALRRRKTVCGGYANLFADLAKHAGLEVRVLTGWIKGSEDLFGGRLEKSLGTRPNHAWNAVRIEDRWHLMDLTCVSGGWVGSAAFEKEGVRHRMTHQFKKPGTYLLYILARNPGAGYRKYEAAMMYKCVVR
jgi:transglutaminase-like putative cysteine protease